ncbi:hypothetical protein [Stenotrophomonas maltophilia]|uniref:hypothetical protein n=1 Tax=Stenotrophomonas maltophilia TaxID=40324 RepID=UPI0009B27C2D|nr:hypothetical protein [Stenotrophomonas maltophilia]
MSNDKITLADAQPGGRVGLGDQAERARFEAWAEGAGYALTREDGRYEFAATRCAWTAWRAAAESRQIGAHEPAAWVPPNFFNKGVVAATARRNPPSETAVELRGEYVPLYLSAQPSPGGQGGLNYERMFVDACAALAEVSRELGCDPEQGGAEPILAAIAELREALAARQPVGEQRAALWIQFAENGNIRFWTKDQDRALAESFLHARPLTAFYASPQPPAQAVDLAQEPMFYIQDTRQFVGNCPVWWAPNGAGYVTRLDEAGRYTEQEAVKQNRTRDTDVPWPCAEIDAIARHTVDFQHMRPRAERLAELDLIDSPAVQS